MLGGKVEEKSVHVPLIELDPVHTLKRQQSAMHIDKVLFLDDDEEMPLEYELAEMAMNQKNAPLTSRRHDVFVEGNMELSRRQLLPTIN